MSELYNELFFRNSGTINEKQQKTLREVVVGIVGLGGTGGFVLENLIRVGIENFVIFDFDRIELSNFNRQILATFENLDSPKVKVAQKHGKNINPNIKIKKYSKRFTFSDWQKLKNCNLLVDCSDNVEARINIANVAKKLKIPFVFCSAGFSRGMVSVFESKVDFEKVMNIQKNRKYLTCESIISTVASLAGTLASVQAVNYLIGKPYVKAPEFLFFDIFGEELIWKNRI
ncbi:ThiF family adenylyltransferase [Candidatus Micrarchaeota archaeon]|nr:ThiF family adenylyltransferase [Candidatus Micrarchaeota archaeon]